MPLTKVTSSLINTISASQITATGATAGQVLTYNGSTSTWVASAAPSSLGYFAKCVVDFTKNAAGTADSSNTARYITGSYNISSVVKTATGAATVNFTNNAIDTNYVAVLQNDTAFNGNCSTSVKTVTVNSFAIEFTQNGVVYNPSRANVVVFA